MSATMNKVQSVLAEAGRDLSSREVAQLSGLGFPCVDYALKLLALRGVVHLTEWTTYELF